MASLPYLPLQPIAPPGSDRQSEIDRSDRRKITLHL